jgi:probable F420-dependent oxidoreductase
MLGAMAAVTERIHLRTGVHLALLRHPITVARAAATTALLSGNRLELGVGVGWLAQEYEVFGVDFTRRGAMLDELVVALRALWHHGPVEHHGTFWDLGPMHLEPAPDRPIPILIGGRSDAAHRRAARLGDGYLMSGAGLEEALETADRINALRAEYGRAGEPFAIHATAPDARTPDDFARLRDHGMASVTVSPWAPGADLAARLAGMERFASETLAVWPG